MGVRVPSRVDDELDMVRVSDTNDESYNISSERVWGPPKRSFSKTRYVLIRHAAWSLWGSEDF